MCSILDAFDKAIHLTEDGVPLLEGRALVLRAREGIMLPLDLTTGDVRIVYATAEVTRIADGALDFRLTQPQDVIVLETNRRVLASDAYTVDRRAASTIVGPPPRPRLRGRPADGALGVRGATAR